MFNTNAKSHRRRNDRNKTKHIRFTYGAQTERERERDEGGKMPITERARERDEQRLMENKGTHLNLNWELRDDGNKSRLISRT